MGLNDGSGNCQSEPGVARAAFSTGGVDSIEPVEQLIEMFGLDGFARVLDG
ncbi:hypothetical protein D3C85_1726230 [compost metagenome]